MGQQGVTGKKQATGWCITKGWDGVVSRYQRKTEWKKKGVGFDRYRDQKKGCIEYTLEMTGNKMLFDRIY